MKTAWVSSMSAFCRGGRKLVQDGVRTVSIELRRGVPLAQQEGDPKFAASQTVPQVPYADYAQSLGLGATKVASPTEVGPAWDAALAADRPFLIHAVVDPA